MSTCNFLKEPLQMKDLFGKGCEFRIDEPDGNQTNDEDDDIGIGNDEEVTNTPVDKLISSEMQPFDELRQRMVKINPYLYKRIIKKGNTDVPAVPKNVRVHICYSAYWEGESVPFDSTYLRTKPCCFITGMNTVLEGLNIAVQTMHIGEEAHFVISYHLLFHEMGCPPRIKPKADALLVIELQNYDIIGDLHYELSEEGCYNFNDIIGKVKDIHLNGLDSFRNRNIRIACQAFERAVTLLYACEITNKTDEVEQTKLLIQLYTNMAVCYNKLQMPIYVCKTCQVLRSITDKPSCKALFQEARALLTLGEYKQSRQLLLQAQRLEPNNEYINRELQTLDKSYRRHKEYETSMCKRALGVIKSNDKASKSKSEENESDNSLMETEILELFNNFKLNNSQNTLVIPAVLTANEVEHLRKLGEKMNMKMLLHPENNKTYIIEKSI